AALLAGYVTVANVSTQSVKDLLMGREVRVEDIPDKSLWALLGVYGLNQYTYDRYLSQGDIKGAVIGYVAPATPVIDAAFTLATELPKDDPAIKQAKNPETIKQLRADRALILELLKNSKVEENEE
ncbi:MAG: hypothetical protein VW270_23060, partial [Candidatus Poseidoniales archaeon]